MTSLRSRIQTLADHGSWFRKRGGPSFLIGLCLVVISVVIVWPEKDRTETLNKRRLVVPIELAESLKAARVDVLDRPVTLVEPADESFRLVLVLLPFALWLVWEAIGLVLKSWAWRAPLLVFVALPSLLVSLSSLINDNSNVPTIKVGHVAAREGRPIPPDEANYGGAQPLPAVYAPVIPKLGPPMQPSRPKEPPKPTIAHHLRTAGRPPLLADQAHFVLAQQAYRDAEPENVAAHLRALTDAWQPTKDLFRTILGVLADYAEAHKLNAGEVALRIADGRPYQALRWTLTAWSMRLGTLLIVIGIALECIGLLRQRAAKRLTQTLDRFGIDDAAPVAS